MRALPVMWILYLKCQTPVWMAFPLLVTTKSFMMNYWYFKVQHFLIQLNLHHLGIVHPQSALPRTAPRLCHPPLRVQQCFESNHSRPNHFESHLWQLNHCSPYDFQPHHSQPGLVVRRNVHHLGVVLFSTKPCTKCQPCSFHLLLSRTISVQVGIPDG
jgi:hypothetical protein